MKYVYSKLVRDKIPEQIQKETGRQPYFHILGEEEYKKELNRKVLEEAHEFIEENSVEELADLLEVIDAIRTVKNISMEQVEEARKKKREKKGAFEKRFFLEYVQEETKNEEEEKELKKSWRKQL